MGWVDRARRTWHATPLVTRMVTLITALLALGLAMAGTVMIGLLQRHLIAQVDEQLITSAESLVAQSSQAGLTTPDDDTPNVPTLFYIRRVMVDGSTTVTVQRETLQRSGTPQIPELLALGQLPATDNHMTHPVTVTSTRPGSPWRAVALPLAFQNTSTPAGVMTIALPLTDVQRTLANTAAYFTLSSVVIVAAGGVLGRYLVRRSLSSLRNIESVAGQIAAGDLTQRIEPEPPTTEVGSLALSLNTMLSQVEQSFEARERSERRIRRFVSDASHELRTPLAAIRGYGELYAMGGVPPERTAEVMGRIRSEAGRMGNLVEDLLTLARLDEGRALTPVDVDLVKVADNAAFDLQALDPMRAVRVTSLTGRTPPMTLVVCADRDRIQQVFTNLVGNIDRYTPQGSPVELALGASGSTAVVEFRDHGPGIAPEDHDRVFERFYRADNSRARSLGGSGLGLSIVAGILAAHHGSAKLTRTRGGGLTVRIELPMAGAPEAEASGTEKSGTETAAAETAGTATPGTETAGADGPDVDRQPVGGASTGGNMGTGSGSGTEASHPDDPQATAPQAAAPHPAGETAGSETAGSETAGDAASTSTDHASRRGEEDLGRWAPTDPGK